MRTDPVVKLLLVVLLIQPAVLWALDTDNDTLPDSFEADNGRDPLVPDYLISAGWNTTCGKDDSATNGQGVQCWGVNSTNLNNNMPTFTKLTQVVNGSQHACAIDDGSAVCWGSNFDGRATPPVMTNVTHISAFKNHTCAVHDGGVSCWGKDTVGQTVPPALNNPQMVAVGDTHSCAIDENAGVNSVVCWGSDDWGESTVPPLSNPTFIAAGDEHSCAINDTKVKCWGNSGSGRIYPSYLSNPVKLALGENHSCAIDQTGVVCWGADGQGQASPPAATNPVDISLGYQHGCMLSEEGIQCWGNNSNNQSDTGALSVDSDGDLLLNISDACRLDDFNGVVDTDDDGFCDDGLDTDDDNDGTPDLSDNCPLVINKDQENIDGDSEGNLCDDDNDNDGMLDIDDDDDDSDGVIDSQDEYPLDPSRSEADTNIIKSIYGGSAGDYLGISVRNAGDVNGDGYDDLIAGAYLDDNNGTDSGSARVISGNTLETLYMFNGDSFDDLFGISVSGAGDVNGDGYADLIVGAPYDDNNGNDSGSARVFSGVTGATLYTFNGSSVGDEFGWSVSGAGDVNGDGYDDIIVGSYSGSAYVFSGATGETLYAFSGSLYFGNSVSDAGDMNGDGYADIIVSEYRNSGYNNAGSVTVYSGINGFVLYTFDGDNADDEFGYSASGAGDVNADGYDDIIVGAFGDDNNGSQSGSARVLSGATGKILYTFYGDDAGDYFGRSVSGAGDVDGDGYADVIVGALSDDVTAYNGGSARVYSGYSGKVIYIFGGDSADDDFSSSVSGAGDVDGDGYADLVVGAYGDDNNGSDSGSIRLFSGRGLWSNSDSSGAVDAVDDDDDNDGVLDIDDHFPVDPNEWIDTDLDGIGDNTDNDDDNDQVNDASDNCPLLPNSNQLNFDNDSQGDACDYDDDDDGVLDVDDLHPLDASRYQADTNFIYTFYGDVSNDLFGKSVSSAGDVNGDGYDDLIVGSSGHDGNGSSSGSAFVLSGVDGIVLFTFSGDSYSDRFGWSVGGAGDVDSDGYDDLIVGAPYDDDNGRDSGSARVLSGASGAVLYTFYGDAANDYFGVSVSGAGDVNKDGYDDVIVGADRDDNNGIDSGSAYVLSGVNGTELYAFDGYYTGVHFGASVSSAGDVNGDGYADVIVGARYESVNGDSDGTATVFSGYDGGELYVFNGDSGYDYFGCSVSGAGDINGDGYSDLIVGAYQDDNNGSNSGSARIFSGVNGETLYTFDGDSANDQFGYSVSGAGDINGDGYSDVIVGAMGDDNNGEGSGSARVFSGVDGSILYSVNGDSASDEFGRSVSGAGDVNGDGYADLIVGVLYDDNNGSASGSARVVNGIGLWSDFDLDTENDYLDADDDNDGVLDINDEYPLSASSDNDDDGIGDIDDNCPLVFNPDQVNFDNDAFGDVCDPDDDNDGVSDDIDDCDTTPVLNSDNDGDGCDDATEDLDDDNDGMPDDWENAYGFDPLLDDSADDADGDDISNLIEYLNGSNPLIAKASNDFTNDGIAGWIWRGVTNGVEGLNRTWTPNWAASSPGWVPPSRTYPPPWDATLDYGIQTTGDFDGDGDSDIAWRSASTGTWKFWRMEDGNRVGQNTVIDSNLSMVTRGAGDTDKDGDDDIILQDISNDRFYVHRMQDNTLYQVFKNLGSKSGYDIVRIADFDGDGDVDLLLQERNGTTLVFREIENSAFVQDHDTQQTGTGFTTQCAGDFNGNGNADVYLLADDGTSKWFEYVDFVRQQQVFGANQAAWSLLGCGDYDGDGDMDMLWSSADGLGYNRLFINEGFNNSATFYTNRYGGTNAANPGYGYEKRGNEN